MSRQFLRFLLTGGVAALVNLGARYLLNLAIPFEAAVPIAYMFGMVTAYFLALIYVFEDSGGSRIVEFKRFTVVNILALVVVWGISSFLLNVFFPWAHITWHAHEIAHFIGVLSPAGLSYFCHLRYTFAK